MGTPGKVIVGELGEKNRIGREENKKLSGSPRAGSGIGGQSQSDA